jgi:hypothetical protein
VPAAEEVIPYWVTPLADIWLLRDLIPYHGSDAQQLKALRAAIIEPLRALGFSPASMGSAFDDYVMTMVPVLFGLAAHRSQRAQEESRRRERGEAIRRSVQANTAVHAAQPAPKRSSAHSPKPKAKK